MGNWMIFVAVCVATVATVILLASATGPLTYVTSIADRMTEKDTPHNMTFIVKSEGKQFFALFSPGKNWTDAYNYCRSFGMKLATMATHAQYQALNDSYSNEHFYGGYWTSCTDANLMRQFSWTPFIEQPGDYLPYRVKEYENPRGCLAFSSQMLTSVLYSRACHIPTGILCEMQ